MTFKNMKFESCGASAIELIPPHSNAAGGVSGTNQHITFDGYFDMSKNLIKIEKDGEGLKQTTQFFEHYNVAGTSVPVIISSVLSQYNDRISHLLGSDNKVGFVSFILADMTSFIPNDSMYSYPDSEDVNRGIINADKLPTNGIDTTHQYIELNVKVNGMDIGKVILYNRNYRG